VVAVAVNVLIASLNAFAVNGLENDCARACTAACTDDAEAHHDKASGTFADALAMIARLPLSDADKADAVRRLLTVKEKT